MEAVRTLLFFLVLRHSVSSLELTGLPVHAARLGSDTRVPCPFTVDNPPVDLNHLTIFWYFRDKEVLTYDKTVRKKSPRYSLSTGVLEMGIANLNIYNIQIPDGGMYKCSVIYGSEKKEKEVRLDIGAPPQVTITNKMAVVNEESVLRCSVTGFYPVDIDIKWFKDGEELNNISTEDPQRNSDRTYSVKSAVTIIPTEEDLERIFSCRVYQDFLHFPLQKDFRLVYEAPPQVTITDKKVVLNAKSVLRCSATGFFPPDIDIKWIRDGKQLEDNISIGDPWRNPNRTYSVNSTVTITPTEEDREQNFSCRVHHKSLQEPLQEDFHLVYEDRSSAWIMAVCYGPVVILIIIIAVVLWWRLKWRKAPLIICDIVGPPKLIDGEEAVLCCTVDDAPEDLCATWLIRRAGQEQEIQTSQRREHSEEEESLLDTSYVIKSQVVGRQYSSSLSFIPHMERHKDVTFICRGVSGKRKGERTFSCETIYAPLIICDIVGPPKLIDGEEAVLCCTVDDAPEDLCATWLIRAGQEQEIQTSQRREDSEEEESLLDTFYVIKSQVVGRQYSSSLSFILDMERHKDVTFICRGVSGKRKGERTFSCETIYVKPKISQPIIRSLSDCKEMKYLLNLEKFYPKSIKIVWTCGEGRTQKVILSNDTISENIDRTYNVSSEIDIPEDQHKDPGFRVRVTWEHDSMKKRKSRELNIRDSDYIWTPVVEEIQIPRLLLGSPAVLQCNISEYFPDAVTVKWKRRDGDQLHEETDDNQRITSRRAADNTYSCTASLTITPELQTHQGAKYICLVEHPSLQTPIERRAGPLQVYGKPQMSAPIEITMPDSSHVQFSLNLRKFYPEDIKISWRSENTFGKYVISAVKTIRARDEDLTYEVTSVGWISNYSFRDPEMEIIVEWKHESMETSETRSLSVRDFPWRPHVESINVPELEDGKAATLTCNISGYFMDLLSVNWLTKKDGNVTELPRTSDMDKTHKISYSEKRQKDNTYSYRASLTFTPIISSHEGSEILCRVEHPSEERPIERSTAPLHIDVKKQNSEKSAKQLTDSRIQFTKQLIGIFGFPKEKALTPGSKNNETDETGQESAEDAGAEPQGENPDL